MERILKKKDSLMDNEFLLQDRIQKTRQIIDKYGEENFYISFSGGKDSCVLSDLIDWAIPNNKIPRVYADTGIELNMIRDFVYELQKNDKRIEIIQPSIPINPMLENEGYPFKSKHHSKMWSIYNKNNDSFTVKKYVNCEYNFHSNQCPKCLKYQFSPKYKGPKISDMCCKKLKIEPIEEWKLKNKIPYGILGLTGDEEGRRSGAKCLSFSGKKLKNFQPLTVVDKKWEDWFIEEYDVVICNIYKPPYNYIRTGCKGCPFDINLQKDLITLEKFFPNERKQCEILWKPVYDEYRRIGYRLKGGKGENK